MGSQRRLGKLKSKRRKRHEPTGDDKAIFRLARAILLPPRATLHGDGGWKTTERHELYVRSKRRKGSLTMRLDGKVVGLVLHVTEFLPVRWDRSASTILYSRGMELSVDSVERGRQLAEQIAAHWTRTGDLLIPGDRGGQLIQLRPARSRKSRSKR